MKAVIIYTCTNLSRMCQLYFWCQMDNFAVKMLCVDVAILRTATMQLSQWESRLQAGWLGLNFWQGQEFLSLPQCLDWLWVLPTLLQWDFFLWEKSRQEMKLTSHLCKMINVWSYTSISPYNFMACILLKCILYMYGFVCNEHRDRFIFPCNTMWLFLCVICPLYFLHLELTNFCLFGLIVMVKNFICIIFCHHLYKAFLFYLSSFMLHSSKNVT